MNERTDVPSTVRKAERWIDDHTEPEHPRRYADSDEPTNERGELRQEQIREGGQTGAFVAVPAMTGSQFRGLFWGTVIGGLIGAVVFLPLGLIPFADLDIVWRLLIASAIGATGGATVGSLYMGGRMPELEGESLDADNRPSAGSSLRDPHSDSRGR